MIGAMAVILVSWWLNAAMDAIDHSKGAETLNELWHILKAASYWPLYVWIMWRSGMTIPMVALTSFLCGTFWTVIYRGLRHLEIRRLDDKLKLPWLCWLWDIKRP